MKKLLLSASALYNRDGSASAADLRAPVYRAAPVVVAPMNWTGFYVGISARVRTIVTLAASEREQVDELCA
jgi:hypothetical protein